MNRKKCLLSFIGLWVSFFTLFGAFPNIANALGTPHIIYGNVTNSDGTVPSNGTITFEAYISGRSSQKLTQSSTGCGYANGYWWIEVGNFTSPWSVGETLNITITNTTTNKKNSNSITLNSYGKQIKSVSITSSDNDTDDQKTSSGSDGDSNCFINTLGNTKDSKLIISRLKWLFLSILLFIGIVLHKFQISNPKFQIPNFKSQISKLILSVICFYMAFIISYGGSPSMAQADVVSFDLKTGWNGISVPFTDVGITDSEDLNKVVSFEQIRYWDTAKQDYVTYQEDNSNITITPGKPYFIYVTENKSWTIAGNISANIEFQLTTTETTNINAIALPSDTELLNAEELAIDIPNCDTVWYWDASQQKYIGHPKGTVINNFQVKPGHAYFVHVTQNTTWNQSDPSETDNDGDNYTESQGDCNDNNSAIYPSATEICNDNKDNDCDEDIDCADSDCVTNPLCMECTDADTDGYYKESGCGTTLDCNDNNSNIHPGATEICGDGIDQDCNGIDTTCPLNDDDGDGYNAQVDCDDTNAQIYPGATEICGDGIDQDCNGNDTECPADDYDGDGYTEEQNDCDDTNAQIYPGATEICGDGIDQDCNGIDTTCPSNDNDGDGYNAQVDCDDTNAQIYPGAAEICGDGIDQDCNGSDTECSSDVKEGVFLDSFVQGLEYKTNTQTGITDENGIFKYKEGETIIFSIGGIILGEAEVVNPMMTPVNLVDGATDETDETVINIARFLQTLDDDDNLSNGIFINNAVREAAANKSVNFALSLTEFEENDSVQQVVKELTALRSSGERSLVPADEASEHLHYTLLDIDDDQDGYTENEEDCDDNDPNRYPGATEVCNDGIDQDCNGEDMVCPTYPVILSTVPADNATDVDVNTMISVTFSMDMNPETIHKDSFYVQTGTGYNFETIAGNIAYIARLAIFTPDSPLDNSKKYTVTMTTDIQSTEGNPLQALHSWSFITETESGEDDKDNDGYTEDDGDCNDSDASIHPDATEICGDGIDQDCDGNDLSCTELPVILSNIPRRNDVGVNLNTKIMVYFSQTMDSLSINANTFYLRTGTVYDYRTIAGEIVYSGTTAILTPTSPLDTETRYEVIITTEIKNSSGISLENGKTWAFTTGTAEDTDNDEDGFTIQQGDCDDNDKNIHPLASEICSDGIDQDCDGKDLSCPVDDQDGDGFTIANGDCDDTNAGIHPDATEICDDGIDQDCDGIDLSCGPGANDIDNDGDGFTENQGDCDDDDAEINPDAMETCGDGIDQDCDESDLSCDEPPTILSVSPANNATEIAIDTEIIVHFSQVVDTSSINENTFYVQTGTGYNISTISGTITCNGAEATFSPNEALDEKTVYEVTLTTGVKNVGGTHLESDYTWQFTTGSMIIPGTPEIVSTEPADNATNVDVNPTISVTFSEPMNSESINSDTFYVQTGTGYNLKTISGTVTCNGAEATFSPNEALDIETTYTVIVTTGVKNSEGTPLGSGYTWQFTTMKQGTGTYPYISSVVPSDNAVNVNINTEIRVLFSMDMNPSTINKDTFYVQTGDQTIAGTVNYSETTATFSPDVPLNYETLYTVTITKAVQSSDGNNLLSDYTWQFSTIAASEADNDKDGYTVKNDCNDNDAGIHPCAIEICGDGMDQDCDGNDIDCSIAPIIISTLPENNDTDVDISTVIKVDFSQAMDAGTINIDTFYLRIGTGYGYETIAGEVIYEGITATFLPNLPLEYEIVYEAIVTTGAKNSGGTPIASDYTWQFTTGYEDDVDSDDDGYTTNQGDCNDNQADIYPGAIEICNDSIDQDCDGNVACIQPENPGDCLTAKEVEFAGLVNEFRKANGLTEIPISKSLTQVAQWHVIDLYENVNISACPNLYSWSDQYPDTWDTVCYGAEQSTPDPRTWSKPSEITKGAYADNGYEFVSLYCQSFKISAFFESLKNISDFQNIALETGSWSPMDWKVMGVGIYEATPSYVSIWFGAKADPQGTVSECQPDNDGDGYSINQGDCNDNDAEIHPKASEICNDGKDNDCDGAIDCVDSSCYSNSACYQPPACSDTDGDGYYAQSECGTEVDCNDGNAGIHPGATEVCDDGVDQDCDGSDCNISIYTNRFGMTFKRIPKGTFTMGSPADELGREDDETLHQVTLTQDYYIQSTEVTQAQWEAVMGNNPSDFSECGEDCPVENVSWNDVQEFIVQMNGLGEGAYRLPTEAEWEYAARAGSNTAFASGDIGVDPWSCDNDPNLDMMGFYCGNSCVSYAGGYDCSATNPCSTCGTNPVVQKKPNAFGLYDMHGNVSEWCQDWYGDYPTEPVSNPMGTDTGTERVVRGGSWVDDAGSCRSANRSSESPDVKLGETGFRLIVILSNGD